MTYEVYRYIFLGTLIASCLMAALSVALFFAFKIPKIIGDLSGRTARKAIENIRKQNEESGDKTFRSSDVNRERGKVTDKISRSGRIVPRGESPFGTGTITEQLAEKQSGFNETTVLSSANETTVLSGGNETTVLSGGNETTVLSGANETTVLSAPAAAPEAFAHPMQAAEPVPQPVPQQNFVVEYEIVYIHTNEVIA